MSQPLDLAQFLATMPPLVVGKAPADTTVVVAMSGGVDSSCVAALCHAAGYRTIGMTLQLWDYTPASNGGKTKEFGTCCALDDVYDARRVCQTIGIPHYVLNMESAFKTAVIDDFVETYLSGATPIPCVRCNQRIKFVELLDKAKALGADVLVTGHYVQKGTENGRAVLMQGADPTKDQSYYLFTTTQAQLDFLAFPLGSIPKTITRQLAQQLGLHVHVKKDSYDICFVPGGDYVAVVKKFAPQANQPGDIILSDGTVVGQHQGIVGYTVGQRKGIGGGFPEPMFVTEIRPAQHHVVIGPKAELGRRHFTVKDLNWLAAPLTPDQDLPVMVKVRAQHTPVPALIHALGQGRAAITLAEPDDHISPGQAAVCYTASGILLGGGWIETQSMVGSMAQAAAITTPTRIRISTPKLLDNPSISPQ